jgi:hypothetical protein
MDTRLGTPVWKPLEPLEATIEGEVRALGITHVLRLESRGLRRCRGPIEATTGAAVASGPAHGGALAEPLGDDPTRSAAAVPVGKNGPCGTREELVLRIGSPTTEATAPAGSTAAVVIASDAAHIADIAALAGPAATAAAAAAAPQAGLSSALLERAVRWLETAASLNGRALVVGDGSAHGDDAATAVAVAYRMRVAAVGRRRWPLPLGQGAIPKSPRTRPRRGNLDKGSGLYEALVEARACNGAVELSRESAAALHTWGMISTTDDDGDALQKAL